MPAETTPSSRTPGVRERPILFSAPMVLAILQGRKTQTRRLIKPGRFVLPEGDGWNYDANGAPGGLWRDENGGRSIYPIPACPYGVPGDRLWGKERIDRLREGLEVATAFGDRAVYAADGSLTKLDTWPWKRNTLPGIHCPRGLSRIKLDVASVRVQRLHDISEEDAKAEGVELKDFGSYRAAFAWLWGQINPKATWNTSNPWLWAVAWQPVEEAHRGSDP